MSNWRQKIKFVHPLAYKWLNKTIPEHIQIQTTSYCNSNCDYCPYPATASRFNMGKMEDVLYNKIISDARVFGIKVFHLFLMNEPLLDKNLAGKIAGIHSFGGETNLSTNASLLTGKVGRDIMAAGLTRLAINMPSIIKSRFERLVSKLDFDKVMQNLEALQIYANDYQTEVTIQVNVFAGEDMAAVEKTLKYWQAAGLKVITRTVCDRAGNVEKYSQDIYLKRLKGCKDFREIGMVHVLYNGDVILCCMDWKRQYVMGNLQNQTLAEVYYSRPYFDFRKKLYGLTRAEEDFICRKCEFALGS